MSDDRLSRVIDLYRSRGNISDDVDGDLRTTALQWLSRAQDELAVLEPVLASGQWRVAYNTAYDIYRHAAEAVVLDAGFRMLSSRGAREATFVLAGAVMGRASDVFADHTAGVIRGTRNRLEYLDIDRPTEVDQESARWAAQLAERAVAEVSAFLS